MNTNFYKNIFINEVMRNIIEGICMRAVAGGTQFHKKSHHLFSKGINPYFIKNRQLGIGGIEVAQPCWY